METSPDTGVPRPSPVVPVSSKREPDPSLETDELERLIADIAARLRGVCAQLPEAEFSALVLDIARVRMRYEPRVTPLRPERRRDD